MKGYEITYAMPNVDVELGDWVKLKHRLPGRSGIMQMRRYLVIKKYTNSGLCKLLRFTIPLRSR